MVSEMIKQRFFRLAETVHLRIFGHAMSDEMRKFIGNMSCAGFLETKYDMKIKNSIIKFV